MLVIPFLQARASFSVYLNEKLSHRFWFSLLLLLLFVVATHFRFVQINQNKKTKTNIKAKRKPMKFIFTLFGLFGLLSFRYFHSEVNKISNSKINFKSKKPDKMKKKRIKKNKKCNQSLVFCFLVFWANFTSHTFKFQMKTNVIYTWFRLHFDVWRGCHDNCFFFSFFLLSLLIYIIVYTTSCRQSTATPPTRLPKNGTFFSFFCFLCIDWKDQN